VLYKIVHKAKFQQILLRCITHIVGKSDFCWSGGKRSWQLLLTTSLANQYDDLHSKGIFILPHEAVMEPWASITTAGGPKAISRTCGKNPVSYDVYNRVLKKMWLNCDAINAYTSLMEKQEGVAILTAYFWKAITDGLKVKKYVRNRYLDSSDAH
jgi:hypothetical protein